MVIKCKSIFFFNIKTRTASFFLASLCKKYRVVTAEICQCFLFLCQKQGILHVKIQEKQRYYDVKMP